MWSSWLENGFKEITHTDYAKAILQYLFPQCMFVIPVRRCFEENNVKQHNFQQTGPNVLNLQNK